MPDISLPRRRLLGAAGASALAGSITSAALVDVPAQAAGRRKTITFTGAFTSPATPDWHYLPFRVPRGVKAIEVSYDYEATETGAGFTANVIDIGIFDPSGIGLGRSQGFRGWSGGARRDFRVGNTWATPGYLAGPIQRGVWRVILGPFLIVPPGVEYEVKVTLVFGRPGRRFKAKPPRRRIPGTGEKWYRGDLHTHTEHSDGSHSQAALARRARAAGLDFIGSSEHNTSSATLTWGKHKKAMGDLLVICGEEVTTRAGHWLAMGLPAGTWIDWRYRVEPNTLSRFTRRVRSLGGLSIACHPFVPIRGTQWDFGYSYQTMDGVELWNGPWTLDDQTALVAWDQLLREGRFVPAIGNSDTHRPSQRVGSAQTVVRARTLSTPAIVAGLRAGNAWLAESSKVDLTFTAAVATAEGTVRATCGETLDASGFDNVAIQLAVSGAARSLAQIVGPAGPIAGSVVPSSGSTTVTALVPASTIPFVRAEVRRLDSAPVVNPLEGVPGLPMMAMTNPIFTSGFAG